MEPRTFSTRGLLPKEQSEAWSDWFWPLFEPTPQPEPDSFPATNRTWNLNGIIYSTVSAPAARVVRSKTNIGKSPEDHWVLSCCKHGAMALRTDRAEINAGEGVVFLWSLGEPSVTDRSSVERMQLFLPRDQFQDMAAVLDSLRGTTLDGPSGSVLAQYMIALESWLNECPGEMLPRFGDAVHSMVAACLGPSPQKTQEDNAEYNWFKADRVRRIVRENLQSPSLEPTVICRQAGLSRSSLYRLFEHDGGIMHYILRQRLRLAHASLSDPNNNTSIAAISEDLCFSDSSCFSRSFKREFNCSPREVREAARAGILMQRPARNRSTVDPQTFLELIR